MSKISYKKTIDIFNDKLCIIHQENEEKLRRPRLKTFEKLTSSILTVKANLSSLVNDVSKMKRSVNSSDEGNISVDNDSTNINCQHSRERFFSY